MLKFLMYAVFYRTINSSNIELFVYFESCELPGAGQHLKRPNIERPTFRNFEISNIKIKMSCAIFLYYNLFFNFSICLNYSNTQNMGLFIKLKFLGIFIVFQIVKI